MDIINKLKAKLATKVSLKETIQVMLEEYKAQESVYKPNSPYQKRFQWKAEGLKDLAERLEIDLED